MKTNFSLLFVAILPIFSFAQTKAVSVYDRASVFVAPDRSSTPVGVIRFGVDVVDMTLETIQQDKTTFVKVILADGTTGWVSKYVLVPNGEGAVIDQNTPIFQNPVDNVTMVRNKDFVAGEAVVFTEFSGPYAFVVGREKTKQGWVYITNLIIGNEEVRAATTYMSALREPKVDKRLKVLDNLRNQSATLRIYPLIDQAYADVQAASVNGYTDMTALQPKAVEPVLIADNSSMEKANVSRGATQRSASTEANKKVAAPITTPAPVVKSDKQVSSLSVVIVTDDGTTKPFSCYHKTLPIGSKIDVKIPNNPGYMEFEVIGHLQKNEGIGLTEKSLKRLIGDDYSNYSVLEYYPK